MIPISQIAQKYGLSRSTLLYYDRLGLVRPSYRTAAGYRLYQADDEARLKEVCRYRAAGLALETIRELLDTGESPRSAVRTALNQRLTELNAEIAGLRRQQQVVIGLLRKRGADRLARVMNKDKWVALLRSCGLSEKEMMDWHSVFERQSPEAHQDFLESLGLPAAEIAGIRKFARSRTVRA
ncbi:MAG: HTH-type transcriptional activator mta [Verrucomicrobia bacterium ADurb.Bin122]|nr:MAG: HTH-type transcriptional activator mta [Verrucomicrobia bacterium ADurb.Bin122]HOD47552.1 MerR family transcriptional regulator [Opitutaceae bacterium]